ncbi:MAG: hypothetical protein WBW16_06025 [Bacteroidota bacterium]
MPSLLLGMTTVVLAGPPFKTDDPQPVDHLHWEFYLASEQQVARHETDATLPHFEVNYGVVPNMQLHLVAPLGYVHTNGETHYGYSDTELGVKFRFAQETETAPQAGVFPMVEIPTGDENKQLGSGNVQVYLPVWVQKSWGKFTTYGGGGFWYNPGQDQRNWIYAGWELQYDFSKAVTLGGELCYHTANSRESQAEGGFNIGGFINLDDHSHLLFSLGQSLSGEKEISGYFGYQLTI